MHKKHFFKDSTSNYGAKNKNQQIKCTRNISNHSEVYNKSICDIFSSEKLKVLPCVQTLGDPPLTPPTQHNTECPSQSN